LLKNFLNKRGCDIVKNSFLDERGLDNQNLVLMARSHSTPEKWYGMSQMHHQLPQPHEPKPWRLLEMV
jgi:hypothetical protein